MYPLKLVFVLILRLFSPELVMFPDFESRTSLATSILLVLLNNSIQSYKCMVAVMMVSPQQLIPLAAFE